jgi:CRP-like cAMP-binding protein
LIFGSTPVYIGSQRCRACFITTAGPVTCLARTPEKREEMPHRKLVARLQAGLGVSEQDRETLTNMPHTIKTFANGEFVLRQGHRTNRCTIVMSGFLARQKLLGERNQILSFHVPGDIPDLHTLHLPVIDHDLRSVGPSTLALVTHSFLIETLVKSPALMRAFWRETLVDAAIYREWVANLGSRTALPRLAHLLCELASRLEIVGLLEKESFDLRFTQQDFADACGLSAVHVNRTIQELRRQKLIEWEGRVVRLPQRSELERMAEFDPAYLHVGKYE